MKKLCLLLPLFLFFFAACQKDESTAPEPQDCAKNGIAYLSILNKSDNPYDIWIDGVFVSRMTANSLIEKKEVKAGLEHTIKYKQVSGYVLYPTEGTGNFTIPVCDHWAFPFPK